MKVREIMSTSPGHLGPTATLREAAQLMKERDVGVVPVLEGEQPVGILTDRDIAIRAVAAGLDPQRTKVQDAMTKDPVHCRDDADLEAAAELMKRHKVRRLSVLGSDGHLVGVLSLGDLARKKCAPRDQVLEAVSQP